MERISELEDKVISEYVENIIEDFNECLSLVARNMQKHELSQEAYNVIIKYLLIDCSDKKTKINLLIAKGGVGAIREELKPIVKDIAIRNFMERVTKIV